MNRKAALPFYFDEIGDLNRLEEGFHDLACRRGVRSIMSLIADANGFTPQLIDPLLKNAPCPVFGGVFPQLIAVGKNHTRGSLLVGLPVVPRLTLIGNLDGFSTERGGELGNALDLSDASSTAVVFVDGLSPGIGQFIWELFANFGAELNYVGGGAGSLTLERTPCLVTPEGLKGNAALIAQLPLPSGIGVSHGWESITESIKVTRATGNTIQELNYRPAFEIYREVVEPLLKKEIRPANFFHSAKGYPFGLGKFGGELVVRDPIKVDEDGRSLVCVGAVPQGSFVQILRGKPENLIEAARKARALATASLAPDATEPAFCLFIDCISRVLFLEEGFSDELAALKDSSCPLGGALTLGEIANTGKDFLEFYNKTAVVALLAPRPAEGRETRK